MFTDGNILLTMNALVEEEIIENTNFMLAGLF